MNKMTKFIAGLTILFCFIQTFSIAKSDLDIIHNRVFVDLMKPEVDDSQVESLIVSIREDGTWPGINYEDVSRTGFQHYIHAGNLVLVARAYKKKKSKFYKNKKARNAVELALNNWVVNDYICDNWWHNQIGVPNHMVTLMLIMGDKLPDELVKKTSQ